MIADENFDIYVPIYQVEIEGELLSRTAILSVSVDENLESPAKFDMTLNEGLDMETQRFTWLDDPLLDPGNETEIFFGYAGKENHSMITGTIKALSPGFQSTGVPSLTVEGYDFSHDMQMKTTKINDEKVSLSDIATELAGKYNLKTDGIEKLDKKYKKVDRQKNEKDYAFLRGLANKIGFEFFVRGETLYFRKPKDEQETTKNFQYRKNVISFSPRLSMASVVKEVEVYGWNGRSKNGIKGKATLDKFSPNSEIMKLLKKFLENTKELKPKKIEDKAITSKDEASERAEIELKKAVNTFIQGNLECIGDPELRPGIGINIDGIGTLFSGNYYITSAKHMLDDNGYKTTLGVRRIIIGSREPVESRG